MLHKLRSYVLISGIIPCKLQGDLQHALAEKAHPRCAVGLLQRTTGRQRGATIKDANVVEPQKAALEQVVAFHVLTVYPPGEIQQQLPEHLFQRSRVLASELFLLHIIEERSVSVDRRVYIAKVPFISRDLATGMEIELAQHQVELPPREVMVDHIQGNGVKSQVP